ncbi:MAG: hypothetical protein JNL62_22930 [Bryobacterales bacterium]|nr:hypothetical protein [Bryobacterales bacterium]
MRDLFTAADAAISAIDNLTTLLADARKYLEDGRDLAAWGTLTCFDEAAEDLRAAIRLHKSFNRRRFS